MDTKEIFSTTIFEYYQEILINEIPKEYLKEMSNEISGYYYEQYYRFKNQYPKSNKRYSSFQIKDLNHPQTYDLIIKYFKLKVGNNYTKYLQLVLNMNEKELETFEKYREDFNNK